MEITIKKLLYTFLAVSIIFSACEKEESSSNNNTTGTVNTSEALFGLWDYDSYEFEGEITLVPTGIQYEFLSNGYMNILNDTVQDIYTETYTYTNTQITLTVPSGVDVLLTYDISASNNLLQLFQTVTDESGMSIGMVISNFSRH